MSKYKAFSEDSEVIGRAMLGFIKSVNHDDIEPFLIKHGIRDVDPDTWYSLQQWLNVMSDISESGNAMLNFVSIGIEIFQNLQFPPQFENMSYEEVVFNHDKIYHKSVRGTDVGGYMVEKLDDNHLRVITRTPFPDDFVYGSLYGEAKRFLPEGSHIVISYEAIEERRDMGGEETVFIIEW